MRAAPALAGEDHPASLRIFPPVSGAALEFAPALWYAILSEVAPMTKKLGFLGAEEEAALAERESPIILPFDDGGGLTSDDLNHHLIVFGITGSGKTTNVLLPVVDRLIREGHGLLVMAVKDSLSEYVRILAERHGRAGETRIYGAAPGAERLNVLEGKSDSEVREFFDDMVFAAIRGQSHNYDFHLKGIRQASDCHALLQRLRGLIPGLVPSITLVSEMLNDFLSSAKLWKFWLKFGFDENSREDRAFRNAVLHNPYHILNEPTTAKEKEDAVASRYEQLGYQLGLVRSVLRSFEETPGIPEYFSNPGGAGMDMDGIAREGGIGVIQFNPEAGKAGESLGRALLGNAYKAVLKHGRSLPEGKKFCVVIDEFQSVADLSARRYSDSSFVSMAREFNGVFVAATQSFSALQSKGEHFGEVESLLSNCNSSVYFYTADPATEARARQHSANVVLSELKPGTAFVVHYNRDTREHAHGQRTFRKAYEETRALFEGAAPPEPQPDEGAKAPSLADFVEAAEGLEQARAEASGRARADDIMEKKKKAPRIYATPVEKSGREEGSPLGVPEPAGEPRPSFKNRDRLALLFPEYFSEGAVIEIPEGWKALVERIFLAFSGLGLPATVSVLAPRRGCLRAESDSPRKESAGVAILNSLLSRTSERCMLCGRAMEKTEASEDEFSPLCRDCLAKYSLDFGGRGE